MTSMAPPMTRNTPATAGIVPSATLPELASVRRVGVTVAAPGAVTPTAANAVWPDVPNPDTTRVCAPAARFAGIVTAIRAAPVPSVSALPTVTGVEYSVASTVDEGANPVTSAKNCWPGARAVTALPSAATRRTDVPGVDEGGVEGATDAATVIVDEVAGVDAPTEFVAVTEKV